MSGWHDRFDPKKPPDPELVGLAAKNPADPALRVYVASAYGNKESARGLMQRCQAAGFAVTYDWTDEINVQAFEAGAQEWCARRDLGGVDAADVVVVLEARDTCGMWIELGYALARRKPIVFLPYPRPPATGGTPPGGGGLPFIRLDSVTRVEVAEEVIPTLRGFAAARRARGED